MSSFSVRSVDMFHSSCATDDGFEVFVWIGKEASIEERRVALNKAVHYLNEKGRPLDTPISRILEGGENEVRVASVQDVQLLNCSMAAVHSGF